MVLMTCKNNVLLAQGGNIVPSALVCVNMARRRIYAATRRAESSCVRGEGEAAFNLSSCASGREGAPIEAGEICLTALRVHIMA